MKVDLDTLIEQLSSGGFNIISSKGVKLGVEFLRVVPCCTELCLDDMTAKQYVHSQHFTSFKKKTLEENKCQGCGNKASKLSIVNWNNRGHETKDDVIVLCPQCEIVDGQIVSHKELKKELKKEIKIDPAMKDMVREALKDIVTSNAIKALLGEEDYGKN